MTAAVITPSRRATRPSIPFFWWLKVNRTQAHGSDKSVYITDRDYIPAGTADLWKRC